MQLLKIAICDDEPFELELIRRVLKDIISGTGMDAEFSIFDNSAELLRIIETGTFAFDMFFLDMYIDEKIGLDIARAIRAKNSRCVIIFITAFSDRMSECFEWKASAYLTKPVEKDKLKKAFQTGITHLSHSPAFFVNAKDINLAIPFDEIIYFENNLKNIKLYRVGEKEPVIFPGAVSAVNAPEEYFRLCHNSFLINFTHVSMIDKTKHDIVMKNGARIHISRKYYAEVVAAFTRFHSVQRK